MITHIAFKVIQIHIKTYFILNAVKNKIKKSIFFKKENFCVIYGSLTDMHLSKIIFFLVTKYPRLNRMIHNLYGNIPIERF